MDSAPTTKTGLSLIIQSFVNEMFVKLQPEEPEEYPLKEPREPLELKDKDEKNKIKVQKNKNKT